MGYPPMSRKFGRLGMVWKGGWCKMSFSFSFVVFASSSTKVVVIVYFLCSLVRPGLIVVEWVLVVDMWNLPSTCVRHVLRRYAKGGLDA